MKLSQDLEKAVFVLSDNDLLNVLSEDVIHDMQTGNFSSETVEEALVGIFVSYGLTEDDESIVGEVIDEWGESEKLAEGFLSWLKGAAKNALKAVGQAAMDAAKEGGKQAISTSAAELKKRIKAKEKKEPAEPPQPEGAEKEEPEEKPKKKTPKRKPKSKPMSKTKSETKPRHKEKDSEEPEEEQPRKARKPKSKPKIKKPEPKPEPKPKDDNDDDDDDEDESGDIKQNLKNIAGKALGKISDNPEKAKEILSKHGKKAARALAKHGVKKGMKMVFGRWVKTKSGDKGSKKEALDWLISHSDVHSLEEESSVYDYEGVVPSWVTEALSVCGSEVREVINGNRVEFIPGDVARFMMLESVVVGHTSS